MRWGGESSPAPEFSSDEQQQIEATFVDVCYFRRFLTTSRGYAGVASYETEAGDQVVVVQRSKLPLIFRRASGAGDPFFGNLVGRLDSGRAWIRPRCSGRVAGEAFCER